jgi:hypothetical protein
MAFITSITVLVERMRIFKCNVTDIFGASGTLGFSKPDINVQECTFTSRECSGQMGILLGRPDVLIRTELVWKSNVLTEKGISVHFMEGNQESHHAPNIGIRTVDVGGMSTVLCHAPR